MFNDDDDNDDGDVYATYNADAIQIDLGKSKKLTEKKIEP